MQRKERRKADAEVLNFLNKMNSENFRSGTPDYENQKNSDFFKFGKQQSSVLE